METNKTQIFIEKCDGVLLNATASRKHNIGRFANYEGLINQAYVFAIGFDPENETPVLVAIREEYVSKLIQVFTA